MHLEVLVEEESAEEALRVLLPRILPSASFGVHRFNGKRDLLHKLPQRLRAYRSWLPEDWRIVVLIDEDRQDCRMLKMELENIALEAGFRTKTSPGNAGFQVLDRIAVEELEAWFFGDVNALRAAYPRLSCTLDRQARYRNPDVIRGGTWESLEKVLQSRGYHRGGLAKIQGARDIARHMKPEENTSHSFRVFCEGLRAIVSLGRT